MTQIQMGAMKSIEPHLTLPIYQEDLCILVMLIKTWLGHSATVNLFFVHSQVDQLNTTPQGSCR